MTPSSPSWSGAGTAGRSRSRLTQMYLQSGVLSQIACDATDGCCAADVPVWYLATAIQAVIRPVKVSIAAAVSRTEARLATELGPVLRRRASPG
jgi:hypothetical protein